MGLIVRSVLSIWFICYCLSRSRSFPVSLLSLLDTSLPLQTERTMTELEIAVNQRVGEWEVIQESGATLRPLSGPGLTGMKNLGNSCYLNSVMQVLFTVPDFQSKSVTVHHFYLLVCVPDSMLFLF